MNSGVPPRQYTPYELSIYQPIFGPQNDLNQWYQPLGTSYGGYNLDAVAPGVTNPYHMDYSGVTIHDGADGNVLATQILALGNQAVTFPGNIYINTQFYQYDSSPAFASLVGHETTHIWQYTNLGIGPGTIVLQDFAMGGQAAAYNVTGLKPNSSFLSLGYEQQATVVEDYINYTLGNKYFRHHNCRTVRNIYRFCNQAA
jgi:hypothetical protein